MCVITNTTAVVIRNFEDAKRTKLKLTNLNNTGYFTFLYTKCNGRVVITLTLEDRLWKRVYNMRVRSMWRYKRLDVALTPLCKNNSKETVYIDMNSEQDSHRLIITVAHVLSHASSYGICGEQSGTATGFLPVLRTRTYPVGIFHQCPIKIFHSSVTDILSNGQRS